MSVEASTLFTIVIIFTMVVGLLFFFRAMDRDSAKWAEERSKDSFKHVHERIDGLFEGHLELKREIGEVRERVRSTEWKVEQVEGDVGRARREVTEVRSQVTGARGEIMEVRTRITRVQGEVTDVKTDVSELKGWTRARSNDRHPPAPILQ